MAKIGVPQRETELFTSEENQIIDEVRRALKLIDCPSANIERLFQDIVDIFLATREAVHSHVGKNDTAKLSVGINPEERSITLAIEKQIGYFKLLRGMGKPQTKTLHLTPEEYTLNYGRYIKYRHHSSSSIGTFLKEFHARLTGKEYDPKVETPHA